MSNYFFNYVPPNYIKEETDQQSIGAVDGYTARKGVVDGQTVDRGGGIIASSLIHISVHVEVDWIVSQCLLPHVLQLHPRYMDCPEAPLHLIMTADTFQMLLEEHVVVAIIVSRKEKQINF